MAAKKPLDDGPAAEANLMADGYTREAPLGESKAREALQGELEDAFNLPDVQLSRARREVDDAVAEIFSAEHRALRASNLRRGGPQEAVIAGHLDEVVQIGEQIVVLMRDECVAGSSYGPRACMDVLQSGVTTLSAIRLLLVHGFVLDAQARSRGLYELACSAALLAASPVPAEAAKRFLAHSGALPAGDPAYNEAWAQTPKFASGDYEWLRVDYPLPDRNGKPQRITQRFVFDQAALDAADFKRWERPTHAVVHMSDVAVERGSHQAGAAPAGYQRDDVEDIAWRSACAFYELVAHLLKFQVMEDMKPHSALAWLDALRERVTRLRPGWRLPADQR